MTILVHGQTPFTAESGATSPVIPADKVHYNIRFLKNGSNSSMDVNGSSTAQEFTAGPSSGKWYVTKLEIFMSDSDIEDRTNFGNLSGLSNGLLIETTIDSTDREIVNITNNAEMATIFNHQFNQEDDDALANEDPNFVGTIHFPVPITLDSATFDELKATVRDNLTGLDELLMTITAFEVV